MVQTVKDIWESNPKYFEDKTLFQILGIIGNGKLTDNSATSCEFRNLLSGLPTNKIEGFINECLTTAGENSHRALQDLINEVGVRLDFDVEFGLYKGKQNSIGNDGLWKTHNNSIVVETKTTDAFSINLDTIADYRKKLIESNKIEEDSSSILLVVGRKDTGGLEAQIRGSKHAWDIRLISAESLLKLLKIKEDLVDNGNTFNRISQILRPLEFTRLDYLIDTIFTTGEDVKYGNESALTLENEGEPQSKTSAPRLSPVNFNGACVENIQKYLHVRLKKQSRTLYADKENDTGITCAVSKNHGTTETPVFWFAFHPHQEESLKKYKNAYVTFGCGNESVIFIFKFREFMSHTKDMWITDSGDRMYWHVKIAKKEDKYILLRGNKEHIDITNRKIDI